MDNTTAGYSRSLTCANLIVLPAGFCDQLAAQSYSEWSMQATTHFGAANSLLTWQYKTLSTRPLSPTTACRHSTNRTVTCNAATAQSIGNTDNRNAEASHRCHSSSSTWMSAESAPAPSGSSSLRTCAGSSMQYVPSALALTESSPLYTVSKGSTGDVLPSPAARPWR